MQDVDPSIELVACGTCSPEPHTYMAWDRTVLEHMGDFADYISRITAGAADLTLPALSVTALTFQLA